ncbi:MAG: alcohol dehydrogenase catalytic domain-containing protein [Pseudomonadales bacterium]
MKDQLMKGLWLDDGQFSYREDLVRPKASTGELLLKTLCTGICGTDLELQRGYYGYTGIAGHEFVGEVVSQGNLSGKRVVTDINIGCGHCSYCDQGLENHCSARSVIGIKNQAGAFAEYLVVPEANIYLVPDSLSNHQAVLIEPLAAALEVLEQVDVAGIDRALVIGAGRLGLLCAEVLAASGLEVSVLVRSKARLQHFRNDTITTLDQNDFDELPGKSFPLIVESSGSPAGFASALAKIAPRGTVVMKSTYYGKLELDASQVVVNEVTLLGSRCGPFDTALDWMSQHALSHLAFSSHPFSQVDRAFSDATNPSIYKVVFEPG